MNDLARLRARRRSTVALIFVVAAVGLPACTSKNEPYALTADPATERHPPAGPVVGGHGRYEADAWLGIPYAEAPVGDLRWRAPRPLAPWTETRTALASGPPCVQYASPLGGVGDAAVNTPVGQEDCLTLNVWTPRFPAERVPKDGARLPVMVWIHGGGNTIGHAGVYEGGRLAATHGIVVVALQYRLGPFGWLRQAGLRAGAASDEEASGNFGTLDQIRALEWVRDNVSAFGGDPGNVTIFGESAGGQNVFMLLLAPAARGLFHRAIAQSGGVWAFSPAEAEAYRDAAEPGKEQSSSEVLVRLLVRDGLASSEAAARERLASMSAAETASYLRAKNAFDVLAAYVPIPNAGMIDMPRVFSDGVVLPAGSALEALGRPGARADVPLVAGTTRDEYKLFMFGDPKRIWYRLWVLPRFVDEPLYLATADHVSRMWKATGADEPARRIAATRTSDVWVYRFDWDEEPRSLGTDLSAMLGAAHGFEIPFVFGHFDLGRGARYLFTDDNAPGREALSHAMMSYWAEFARSGSPGRGRAGNLTEWTRWGATPESRTLLLDTPEGGGIRMTPLEETQDGVVASIANDARLEDARDRCRVLHDLAGWRSGQPAKEYARLAAENGCADFAFDGYPWES